MVRSIVRDATPSAWSSTTRMRRGAVVCSTRPDDLTEPVILFRSIGRCTASLPSLAGLFLKGSMSPPITVTLSSSAREHEDPAPNMPSAQAEALSANSYIGGWSARQRPFCALRQELSELGVIQ